MQVLTAGSLGMCFGVRDALAIARRLERPAEITINGQLVHNPLVNRELAGRGFVLAEEASGQVPSTPAVLITAHGVSDRRRAALAAAGKTVIDTTCPLVKKAHAAALELQRLGFHVLVIGKRGHVEVEGLTGDLDSFDVIESPADVRQWMQAKLGIIAQTTAIEREVREIVEAVRRINRHAQLRFLNTICQPTRDRQEALDELLGQIDVLIVVGGRNSNNTRHLVRRATERGVPAMHVEDARHLDASLLETYQIAGLTAGTSTLPETIEQVRALLESIPAAAELVAEGQRL